MIKGMKVQVKQDEQHRPSIRLRDPMIARKLSTIEDEDEIRTYDVIEQVGTKGIAQRIIKNKTKLSATKITKTLASLESKQLIKAVKLQKNTQHVKSYVLFHLKLDDPAAGTHTVFGSGTSFDTQCFEAVSKLSVVFLKSRMKKFIAEKSRALPDEMIAFNKSEATVDEVLQDVIKAGIVKADINEESIEAVMKMLELEGKVERREYNEPEGPIFRYRYHSSKSDRPEAAIPCVGCPVKNLCSMDSPINPMDCPHFDNWINNFNF
ncbi:hypothetical protein RvY_07968 [Ramazzottius varieornatus]|uniref:DNA-directed RNA polymerase III subunit RPC6 n=1 Tax=Ramazzottius varieornatus TaxID=947166 RepID=A0A1D1VDF7_RAMVA|nr:hypothetical protein RvY_07968 [Ramazzottius varieornatus]